jgi:tRNA (guanine-N7-)-methyltransferase
LLVTKLKPGAYLHLATDWHNYAEQMLLVLNAETALQNTSDQFIKIETFTTEDVVKSEEASNEFKPSLEQLHAEHLGYVTRPDYRPVTKFENRGIKLGHGVWDLVYKKK